MEARARVPKRYLCPCCASIADSYSEYAEKEARWELEDRLYGGTASTPEKLKAAWDRYGGTLNWESPYLHLPEPIALRKPLKERGYVCEPVKYDTLLFEREVTRNKDFTVTRIHCGGLTVQETVEEHR